MAKIPDKMVALVLTAPGAYELQTIPVPALNDDEVLCRLRAVAICGSDPKIIRGASAGKWPPAYPFIPGHEWAGEVVAVGKNVFDFKPGDRVAGEAHSGCGFCLNCMKGDYNLCRNYGKPETGHRHYGHLSSGAYAQYNVYRPRSIRKMPDNVSFAQGSLVDTAGIALHCLELTGITPGGTVAVIGPGPVGLMTLLLARVLGTAKVIVIGRGVRLAVAEKLGANLLVDFTKKDPVAAVRAATDNFGADEVFECSGAEGTLAQAIKMVRRGGKVGLIGIPPAQLEEKVPFAQLVMDEIAVRGSRANPNMSSKVLNLMASGQLEGERLITHKFPLTDFGVALDVFVNRKEGSVKVIIEPNGPEN
jgi:L-iditol 2-dehydrogenase